MTARHCQLLLLISSGIRIAACFGCAITILSLAFSTFTQQLISIELVPLANTTSPGNLAHSETYSQPTFDAKRLGEQLEFSTHTFNAPTDKT
jgi:hypothetical protein